MSVQKEMAPGFSIFLLDLAFFFYSRMLENFIAGSLGEVNKSKMFQIALKIFSCYEQFFSKHFLHL